MLRYSKTADPLHRGITAPVWAAGRNLAENEGTNPSPACAVHFSGTPLQSKPTRPIRENEGTNRFPTVRSRFSASIAKQTHGPHQPHQPELAMPRRRQSCYIDAEGVDGVGPPTPIEPGYRSRVIWKVILVRRFLIEIRCRTSIRRLIEPPFYSREICRPRSRRGVLHF